MLIFISSIRTWENVSWSKKLFMVEGNPWQLGQPELAAGTFHNGGYLP